MGGWLRFLGSTVTILEESAMKEMRVISACTGYFILLRT